jgi:alpha-L-fucosidase
MYYGNWESVRRHKVPDWYDNCKFGIFIHWGLFSVPAYANPSFELGEVENDGTWFHNNPYAEWYYNSMNVGCGPTYEHHIGTYGKDFAYENFADMWKAENWNPNEWARLFKNAGAKYVVLVTKHHDGFCLFPSRYTKYSSAERGPKKNIVGELTDAVREEGLKMGLYYSGILDWRFSHEPVIDGEMIRYNGCPTHEYADYAYNQCMELIDTYKPSVLWNDIGWPFAGEHNLPFLLAHYYNTCEDGVIDDRFNGLWHDFTTKEYRVGAMNRESKWEMNRGLGLSFGYNAIEGDKHILSVEKLVSLLVSTVANNGNLLINVGPMADGTIPENQAEKLHGIGRWLEINGEAIYDTTISRRASIETANGDIHFTKKDSDLYVMIDKAPHGKFSIIIPDIKGELKALDPGAEYKFIALPNAVELTVNNHTAEQCALVFKIVGGE